MFRYSDDPIADHEAYMVELARLEKLVPVCCYCNRPVMDDYYYEINDEVICAECLNQHFRREVVID